MVLDYCQIYLDLSCILKQQPLCFSQPMKLESLWFIHSTEFLKVPLLIILTQECKTQHRRFYKLIKNENVLCILWKYWSLTIVSNIPFRFTRSLITNKSYISDFPDCFFFWKEHVKISLISLKWNPVDKYCAIVSLWFLCLSLYNLR